MRTAPLLILLSITLPARSETALAADRISDRLVLKQVYLNDRGPYCMMIDTGNGSSILRPRIAEQLGLRPAYAVEAETIAGTARIATAILDAVRVGPVQDSGVEVMITDVRFSGVDGVLGQSWLIRHDYMLDYRNRRLVVDSVPPPAGVRSPLRSADGRPQVSVEVNSRHQDLVVDSGTSVLVLFGQGPSIRQASLVTNAGSIDAGTGSAWVTIGGTFRRRLITAEVNAPPQPGLLPAVAFKSVYVSNREGIVVFVP